MPPRKKQATNGNRASLESVLWDSANKLRNNMDAAEYKHVVLGLIFLKYVSDVFDRRRRQLETLTSDADSDYYMPTPEARATLLESREEYTSEGVFWIPEGHRAPGRGTGRGGSMIQMSSSSGVRGRHRE